MYMLLFLFSMADLIIIEACLSVGSWVSSQMNGRFFLQFISLDIKRNAQFDFCCINLCYRHPDHFVYNSYALTTILEARLRN